MSQNTEDLVRDEMERVQKRREKAAVLDFVARVHKRASTYAGPRNGHQQIAFALKDEVALLGEDA